ncbi:MAG TPA: polysaccharide deacetylase family protein [Acidimicrobiia bacterium]
MDRRTFLAAAAAGVVAVACSDGGGAKAQSPTSTSAPGPTTAPASAAASTAPTTTAPTRARFVDTGPTDHQFVALTFHTDGDLDLAQQLLDALAAHRIVITSFIVGRWLDANPAWAKKLLDGGHELANHTYNHLAFASLPPDQMRDEIVRCRDVLERLTGSPGAFFRPSGTDDGTAPPADEVLDLVGEAGYRTVLGFDVDPLDYEDPGADAVVQRTLDGVHAGAIVSLHFGHPGTIAAVPRIADGLDRRGLTAVHASQLLG